MEKSKVLNLLWDYFLMTVGSVIFCMAWTSFIIPTGLASGGLTGLCTIIEYATNGAIPMGIPYWIMNIGLLIIGFMSLGRAFGIKTIYCVVVMSVIMHFLQKWCTVGEAGSWIAELVAPGGQIKGINAEGVEVVVEVLPKGRIVDIFQLDNKFLSAILGGICSGVGVAMCFLQGGSTGGSDIVVMIVNKFHTISYGKFIRYTDGVIIAAALLLPEIGIDGVIYGFVMVAVFSYTVDMILSGNQQSSQIFIVCKDYKAMADAINNDAKRGATVIDAMGWYSKNESKVVMCVCRKRDLAMVLKVVRSVDPDAFITIGSVMGVYGKGFNALNKI